MELHFFSKKIQRKLKAMCILITLNPIEKAVVAVWWDCSSGNTKLYSVYGQVSGLAPLNSNVFCNWSLVSRFTWKNHLNAIQNGDSCKIWCNHGNTVQHFLFFAEGMSPHVLWEQHHGSHYDSHTHWHHDWHEDWEFGCMGSPSSKFIGNTHTAYGFSQIDS